MPSRRSTALQGVPSWRELARKGEREGGGGGTSTSGTSGTSGVPGLPCATREQHLRTSGFSALVRVPTRPSGSDYGQRIPDPRPRSRHVFNGLHRASAAVCPSYHGLQLSNSSPLQGGRCACPQSRASWMLRTACCPLYCDPPAATIDWIPQQRRCKACMETLWKRP